MAQFVFTGGDGSSGQTGQQIIDGLQNNFNEVYGGLVGYKRTGDTNVLFTNAVNATAATTGALSVNGLRACPFEVRKTTTFSTIYTETTSLAASSKYRVGIYTDSNGYPDALVTNSDVQEYDSGSNGVKSGVFSSAIILTPGIYYFAINSNGTPGLRALAAGGSRLIGLNASMGAGGLSSFWSASLAYGAMPPTFPAGASPSGALLVTLFGLLPTA